MPVQQHQQQPEDSFRIERSQLTLYAISRGGFDGDDEKKLLEAAEATEESTSAAAVAVSIEAVTDTEYFTFLAKHYRLTGEIIL